jgi:hypothetical protein
VFRSTLDLRSTPENVNNNYSKFEFNSLISEHKLNFRGNAEIELDENYAKLDNMPIITYLQPYEYYKNISFYRLIDYKVLVEAEKYYYYSWNSSYQLELEEKITLYNKTLIENKKIKEFLIEFENESDFLLPFQKNYEDINNKLFQEVSYQFYIVSKTNTFYEVDHFEFSEKLCSLLGKKNETHISKYVKRNLLCRNSLFLS